MNTPAPSRRAVIRTAAWTAPAVIVAGNTPAFAASGTTSTAACAPMYYSLDWGTSDYTTTAGSLVPTTNSITSSSSSGTVTVSPTGVAATTATKIRMTVNSSFTGRTRGLNVSNFRNMTLSHSYGGSSDVGGTGKVGLTLMQRLSNSTSNGRNSRQTLTITFEKPVKNLSFTITDIDAYNPNPSYQYTDAVLVTGNQPNATGGAGVAVLPDRFTHDTTTNHGTQGSGTAASPLTSRNNGRSGTAVDTNSRGGNVIVHFPTDTEVKTVTVEFWNNRSGSVTSNGQQAIFLTDFTFTRDGIC
ncbi:hypothetical protein [Nocardioides yefusunii]|uniref:Uncharacterized protein n=1 Tax=Nocardioides yefusunii TaxID=2500546 RepID=A0ABW1QU94_9ACTN|nr:hypothetical protein [Nocardioides yefusunii]